MTAACGLQAHSPRLQALLERERRAYADARPRCAGATARLHAHWLNGAPMHWMSDWALPCPLVVRQASGAELIDLDDHALADFCLGDTGAMFGHSPAPVVRALARQAAHGLTCMLPSEWSLRAGELLSARFGMTGWQMTQTATDANRAVLRWSRALTSRRRVLVFDGCYHGALEDTLVRLQDGRTVARPGQIGRVLDPQHSTAIEFNDLRALERELEHGDVACLLAEPVMTNAGMTLPEDGFWAAARELCTRHGALLAIDETHTLSSGLRGHAANIGLTADFLVIGKSIAGGVPCAVYGASAELAQRMGEALRTKPPGHSGMGTTLAANALATAALVACLEEVMTDAAYEHMLTLAHTLERRLSGRLQQHGMAWRLTRVGARTELSFAASPARTAREALAAAHPELERLLHLYLLNRGVLITPFHNMMLVSPATTHAHLDRLDEAFAACLLELQFLA